MGYEELRYDDVRQKSVHNAFQRDEGIYDQIVYWRVRSIEADLHTSHLLDEPDASGPFDEWFLFHHSLDMFSSVHTLNEFLRLCAAAHRALPGHEVITLFLDIKDGFPSRITSRHSRARFDALLEHHLGDALYRPLDLLARAPGATSMVDAVRAAGWPTLAELRGRFIVVLTGSDAQLANYVAGRETPAHRVAFLSGNATSKQSIGRRDDLVIYNMSREHVALAAEVARQGLVSRAYYIDDRTAWDEAVAAGCHHIATDMVNSRVDGWSTTSGPTGFPFEVIDGPTPQECEPGAVTGIWARSGDVWEGADSCHFRYRRNPPAPSARPESYRFVVSGPNSHTESWTKGGIVARESTDPDARYFGVFRPGQGRGLRVQFRAGRGRSTTVLERHIGPTWRFGSHFHQDTIAHLRLDVSADRRRCAGYGSVDGDEWVELGRFDFDVPLTLHGLSVSSHGQRRGAKYLFVPTDGCDARVFDHDASIGTRDAPAAGWCDHDGTDRWRVTRFSR